MGFLLGRLLDGSWPVGGQTPVDPDLVNSKDFLNCHTRVLFTHLVQHTPCHSLIAGAVQVLRDDGQPGCRLLDPLELGVDHQTVVDVQEELQAELIQEVDLGEKI